MPNVETQLDALYAELPTIECQGKCYAACNGVSATYTESARIAARGFTVGVREPAGKRCDALSAFNTCRVHDIRPTICRVWGVASNIQCSYGCRPSRYLTSREVVDFLLRSFEIGGHPDFTPAYVATTRAYLEANPDATDAYDAFIRSGASREARDAYNYLHGIYGV